MRTRIKFCGITRAADAQLVCEAGADALGMIFYPKSPRCVSINDINEICADIPTFVTTVAVVVDFQSDLLKKFEEHPKIDRIQFHGNESEQDCLKVKKAYYKVLRVKSQPDLIMQANQHRASSALLLDTYVEGQPGGTGLTFDWSLIDKQKISQPVILAGGMSPENVYNAIVQIQPYAVDVNSGVESAPGIKDALRVNEFIIAVREADQYLINHQQV